MLKSFFRTQVASDCAEWDLFWSVESSIVYPYNGGEPEPSYVRSHFTGVIVPVGPPKFEYTCSLSIDRSRWVELLFADDIRYSRAEAVGYAATFVQDWLGLRIKRSSVTLRVKDYTERCALRRWVQEFEAVFPPVRRKRS